MAVQLDVRQRTHVRMAAGRHHSLPRHSARARQTPSSPRVAAPTRWLDVTVCSQDPASLTPAATEPVSAVGADVDVVRARVDDRRGVQPRPQRRGDVDGVPEPRARPDDLIEEVPCGRQVRAVGEVEVLLGRPRAPVPRGDVERPGDGLDALGQVGRRRQRAEAQHDEVDRPSRPVEGKGVAAPGPAPPRAGARRSRRSRSPAARRASGPPVRRVDARAGDVLRDSPSARRARRAREAELGREPPIARRLRRPREGWRIARSQPPRPAAPKKTRPRAREARHERVGGPAVVQHPGVSALETGPARPRNSPPRPIERPSTVAPAWTPKATSSPGDVRSSSVTATVPSERSSRTRRRVVPEAEDRTVTLARVAAGAPSRVTHGAVLLARRRRARRTARAASGGRRPARSPRRPGGDRARAAEGDATRGAGRRRSRPRPARAAGPRRSAAGARRHRGRSRQSDRAALQARRSASAVAVPAALPRARGRRRGRARRR